MAGRRKRLETKEHQLLCNAITTTGSCAPPTCTSNSWSGPRRTRPATTSPATSAAVTPPAGAELSAVSPASSRAAAGPLLLSTEAEAPSTAPSPLSRCRLAARRPPLGRGGATCAAAHSMAPRGGGRFSHSTTTGDEGRDGWHRAGSRKQVDLHQVGVRWSSSGCACTQAQQPPHPPVLVVQLRFMSKWPWGARSRRLHHPSASSSALCGGQGAAGEGLGAGIQPRSLCAIKLSCTSRRRCHLRRSRSHTRALLRQLPCTTPAPRT